MARHLVYQLLGGRIVNAVEWDGNLATWQPPAGTGTVQRTDGNPGDTFNAGAGTITPAPPPTADDPAPVNVPVGPSPFGFRNTRNRQLSVLVAGGTVNNIGFSRNGAAFFQTGVTAGSFLLAPDDRLRIAYTVAPTVTAVPM